MAGILVTQDGHPVDGTTALKMLAQFFGGWLVVNLHREMIYTWEYTQGDDISIRIPAVELNNICSRFLEHYCTNERLSTIWYEFTMAKQLKESTLTQGDLCRYTWQPYLYHSTMFVCRCYWQTYYSLYSKFLHPQLTFPTWTDLESISTFSSCVGNWGAPNSKTWKRFIHA